ncbi:hypothetical protein HHL25_05570 [Rhizobium sp. S-51]|uniref:Secreted protein n=1 Tax=Rhizobium terricola TaxID=2728849 RepID=A0A7Y0AUI6_9HYPH|nr:hypothetical protein [Rhizobium terricola]NML73592.1 hypothetical protein [Rhizobium terricola]
MTKHRRLLLATLTAGTMLTAFGTWAAPLSALVSPARDIQANGTLVHPVDADEDDEFEGANYRKHHHDDGDDHEDEDDDEDDFGMRGGKQHSPAPAGTVTPPDNGLILKGSTPKVVVN